METLQCRVWVHYFITIKVVEKHKDFILRFPLVNENIGMDEYQRILSSLHEKSQVLIDLKVLQYLHTKSTHRHSMKRLRWYMRTFKSTLHSTQ